MTVYRKTMSEAYASMYEATMSSSQIARLKKAYEPMRDKKISTSNANKLSAMMDKVGKDKEALLQLFKADIPFVSQSAVTKLITKHNMKGAEINKMRDIKSHKDNPHPQDEEVDLDEDASNFKSAVARIKKAKSAKDLKKLEKSFERVYKQTGALTDKEFGQLDDMISDKLVKLGEEVELDEVDRSTYSDRMKKFTAMLKDAEKEKPLDKEWIKNLKRRIKSETDDERKKLGINREEVDLDKLPDMSDALSQVRGEEVDLDEAEAGIKVHAGPDHDRKVKRIQSLAKQLGAKVTNVGKSTDGKMSTIHVKGSMKVVNDLMKLRTEEVDLDEGKMSQLHQYIKDKKSAEEIAKLMKVDVKTIKTLMSSNNPEEVEESAASDARRAMRRDKDFSRKDSADDDTDATADDVKGASKNIMMQMRKAQSLNGRFDVEFGDGKKVKIPVNMAMAVQSKYNNLRRPAEKEKFQAKVGKSYRDMLSALKEEVKPKKESVLNRIDRKIKEKNDG